MIITEKWISESIPLVVPGKKRLSLFSRAERKKINQARAMKALPDLSLVVTGQLGFAGDVSLDHGDRLEPANPDTAPETVVEPEVSEPKKKTRKRQESEARVAAEEEDVEEMLTGERSGKKVSKKPKKKSAAKRRSSPSEGEQIFFCLKFTYEPITVTCILSNVNPQGPLSIRCRLSLV